MSKIISGSLNAVNKGAIDWSCEGLVAFGSGSLLVVLHVGSTKVLQTLSGHHSWVSNVCWRREDSLRGAKDDTGHLELASADSSGKIITWDVQAGVARNFFSDVSKTVNELQWYCCNQGMGNFLLALHHPSTLILWNAESGAKVWTKQLAESILGFSLDPFNTKNIAYLMPSGGIMLGDDLTVTEPPTTVGKQFRMALSSSPSTPGTPDDSRKGFASKLIRKPLPNLFGGAAAIQEKFSEVGQSGDDCVTIRFHPASRDRLLLVYPREVLVLDVKSLQTVASVMLERSVSPLVDVLPCLDLEAAFFVQENGCVTLRMLKYRVDTNAIDNILEDVYNPLDATFEGVCSSDTLRVTKNFKVYGAAMCPMFQRQVCLMMSSGKLLIFELTERNPEGISMELKHSLTDLVAIDRGINPRPLGKLKICLTSMFSSVGNYPMVARVNPQSSGDGRKLVAIGTSDGSIQLLDVASGEIERDFGVHACPIRFLEWGDNFHIVSAGYSQTLSTSTVVRNELRITDIRTGVSKLLRPECDETPIEIMRVSHYHCYLAVAFQNQPLEIIDLKNFRVLRQMSRNCPLIVDMAWSGKHRQAKILKKKDDFDEAALDVLQSSDPKSQTVFRENLVVLDNDNQVFHIVVKGMHVRDGKKVATQWATTSPVTAMVWKDDILAFGDNDGRISYWDLSKKESRASTGTRTMVKRLQFSHLLGDYTLLVLHLDGVAIWDLLKMTCLYQLFSQRDIPSKVVDVDILDDNSPVILTSDGALRFFDKTLSQQVSPISHCMLKTIFCPGLLPSALRESLKVLLMDAKMREGVSPVNIDHYRLVLSRSSLSDIERQLMLAQLHSLNADDFSHLSSPKCDSMAERGVFVSKLFGDQYECDLWTLARFYLGKEGNPTDSISSRFDVLCDTVTFRKNELLHCAVFDAKRGTYDQLVGHIGKLVLLKKHDQAVQLLLDTDATHPQYLTDNLKACLISAVHNSSEYQSTMKLVATNLIASGKMADGVQLLSLIDLNVDACRYMQSYGEWYQSAWLAKVSLSAESSSDVMKKWLEYLSSSNTGDKNYAILMAVSTGQFEKALEMLVQIRKFNLAAWLHEAVLRSTKNAPIPMTRDEHFLVDYWRELDRIGYPEIAASYRDIHS